MKKFFSTLATIILTILLTTLTVFLVLKLKEDTLMQKDKDVQEQNIEAESEYLCETSNEKLAELMVEIKNDVGQEIEVADTGSVGKIDIYFVVKVDNDYKYIIKTNEDGTEKFAISQNNEEDAKYIVPLSALELDTCIYTNLNSYSIDREGNITYSENN